MKPYFIISQALYVLCLFPWFLMWGLSITDLDSIENLSEAMFVIAITFFPIAVISCSILAWKFKIKKKLFAALINLVPLLWIFPFII